MEFDPLAAISPIDGRYRSKTVALAPYFSELSFIRYKVKVEVEYFLMLAESGLPQLHALNEADKEAIRKIIENFNEADAKRIKEIEAVTNHDVKAVEYFLKEEFDKLSAAAIEAKEFIHFGLTSQDINNTAVPLMIKDSLKEVIIPGYEKLVEKMEGFANEWKDIPMLARTHGQPASPTLLGKEFRVFTTRLRKQIEKLKVCNYPAKFGGATGNMNAHFVAYPDRDWHAFANKFVTEKLELERSFPTTQIEHYDGLAEIFDCLKRIDTILIDFCVDTWIYISTEYFTQKTVEGEVGSSAMPHKVNPIDFENAEGNFGIANALFEFLSRKLPVSRLQRDLTDSTVMRNIGVAFAHAFLGIQSVDKGLGKLQVNKHKIAADLDKNWAVVAEAIQTVLRREGVPKPYEMLKALTRGNHKIDEQSVKKFINELAVSDEIKTELRKISPATFTGRDF